MITPPFWLTICGGVMQTASAVYVVVALRRHIRRTETETGKLRAVIATHIANGRRSSGGIASASRTRRGFWSTWCSVIAGESAHVPGTGLARHNVLIKTLTFTIVVLLPGDFRRIINITSGRLHPTGGQIKQFYHSESEA